VLAASRIQIAGETEELLATHYRLTGARRDPATLPTGVNVIAASHTDRQSTLIVRSSTPIDDPRGRWNNSAWKTSSSPT
jgi:ABC-2 type transport system ATP-binding protein